MEQEKNQETLLEILNGCQPSDYPYNQFEEDKNLDKASELESLGFTEVATKMIKRMEMIHKLGKTAQYNYIRVAPTRIQEYLKMKAERYNAEHPSKKNDEDNFDDDPLDYIRMMDRALTRIWQGHMSTRTITNESSNSGSFSEPTNDYMTNDENTIGQFKYTETPISEYKDIPPQDTLDALKEHRGRNIFDYFTIGKVSHVPDPILWGRIEGCEDRFYICQWGDDITLDDIL